MPSKAPLVKKALYVACQSLYPLPIKVSYGHPGQNQPDDIVAVMRVTQANDLSTMGNSRHRDEVLDVTVTVSCWSGTDDQSIVTERAYSLLGLLEDYLQNTDPNLGGLCIKAARVVSHELVETEDDEDLSMGRLAEIAAVVRCTCRI